jgi:hypothetical protein
MSIQMGQFRPFGMPREPDRVRWSPLKWLEKCGGSEVDQSLPAAASAAIGGQARHYLAALRLELDESRRTVEPVERIEFGLPQGRIDDRELMQRGDAFRRNVGDIGRRQVNRRDQHGERGRPAVDGPDQDTLTSWPRMVSTVWISSPEKLLV